MLTNSSCIKFSAYKTAARIDIPCEIQLVTFNELSTLKPGEPSAAIRERVVAARHIQEVRYKFLTHFFPSKTLQPFSFCHIHLFISGLPLNGWARQPFIAEGFGAGGDLFADYILFVSSPFVFSTDILIAPTKA